MNFLNFLIDFLRSIFSRNDNTNNNFNNRDTKIDDKPVKEDIATTMVGTNLTKTVSEVKSYKCWVQTIDGKIVGNTHIEMTVAGKTYTRDTGVDGVAELPIRLNKGDYEVHSVFKGVDGFKACEITNYIHVNPDKTNDTGKTDNKTDNKNNNTTNTNTNNKTKTETKKTTVYQPNSKGEYWNPRYLTGTSLKQINSYFCAPVSITQVWYELFGTDESQTEISKYANTTVAGTSHTGINNALQKLASKYNKKIKIEWKNYSSMTLQELAEIVADPNRALILHVMWHNLNDWADKGGHYTTLACVNPKQGYVYEIYSLNGPELLKRTSDYMKTVTSEISQQSVCIITKNDEPAKTTTTTTNKNSGGGEVKGLFVKSSDSGKISFTELKQKGYNHIFLSHMIFEDRGEDYVKKFHEKCKSIGAKLVIFYTTYYNGSSMVNPTSSEAKSRIQKIISIGKKNSVDGVCLDYNRHNSNNHNDTIMNTITANTNKVVSELKGKEVYATCMYEHPNTLKSYYHQDIGKWKATPLPMAYKYNYNYTDYKMNEMKQLIQKTNNKSLLIFQNYHGDENVKDIGSAQLKKDIQATKVNEYAIFRYGTGTI